jgi:hypothetical protein
MLMGNFISIVIKFTNNVMMLLIISKIIKGICNIASIMLIKALKIVLIKSNVLVTTVVIKLIIPVNIYVRKLGISPIVRTIFKKHHLIQPYIFIKIPFIIDHKSLKNFLMGDIILDPLLFGVFTVDPTDEAILGIIPATYFIK